MILCFKWKPFFYGCESNANVFDGYEGLIIEESL